MTSTESFCDTIPELHLHHSESNVGIDFWVWSNLVFVFGGWWKIAILSGNISSAVFKEWTLFTMLQNCLLCLTITLQGTNVSPKTCILKMIFLFPRWDMLIPWRVFVSPPKFSAKIDLFSAFGGMHCLRQEVWKSPSTNLTRWKLCWSPLEYWKSWGR